MRSIYLRWLTAEWGFIRFLMDGYIGWLFWPWRLLTAIWWGGLGAFIATMLNNYKIISFWIAIPFTISGVFFIIWIVSLSRLLLFFPFPICRNGKCCDINTYCWTFGSIYGRQKWGVYFYQCHCGDEYIRDGKKFYLLHPDGSKQPYMELTSFRTWTPADGDGGVKGNINEIDQIDKP
jgi:hypothetical protein